MKTIIIICLWSILLCGCEKDLIIQQKSVISSLSMWKEEGDAKAAMYGMLSQLRSTFSRNYINWGDYRSGFFGDALQNPANLHDLWANTLDANDEGTDWAALYKTINNCNLIIKYVPTIPFSKEIDKNIILGNAYFVRALCYYYCARIWGDVPILLSGFESDKQEDLFPSRKPVTEVYNQIESDILIALEAFPDNSSSSSKIVSKAAVNMLKADFYLWMAKTQTTNNTFIENAKTAVNDVIANPNYKLSEKYESIFTDDNNKEIIFSLNFQKDEYEGGSPSDFLIPLERLQGNPSIINNPVPIGSNAQWVSLTNTFESFIYENPDDTRSTATFKSYFDPVANIRYRWINKYLGEWSNGTRYFTSDIKIYRLAEAILFKAEIENALGNQNNAINELNKIAKRAYGIDNYYPSTLSKNQIDDAILNERLKEFAVEGKSWFDLIRFGAVFNRVPTLKGRENVENILLWPINSASINKNPNIVQTPGY